MLVAVFCWCGGVVSLDLVDSPVLHVRDPHIFSLRLIPRTFKNTVRLFNFGLTLNFLNYLFIHVDIPLSCKVSLSRRFRSPSSTVVWTTQVPRRLVSLSIESPPMSGN